MMAAPDFIAARGHHPDDYYDLDPTSGALLVPRCT
jgi:hypothetical protein